MSNEARKKNKELNDSLVTDQAVSNEIASSVLFHFIAEGYRTSEERDSRKKYLTFLGFIAPNDQEAVLRYAEKYVRESNKIRADSSQIYNRYGGKKPNQQDDATLRQLANNKLNLTKRAIRDLKQALSRDGQDVFDKTITLRVKPRIKVSRTSQKN